MRGSGSRPSADPQDDGGTGEGLTLPLRTSIRSCRSSPSESGTQSRFASIAWRRYYASMESSEARFGSERHTTHLHGVGGTSTANDAPLSRLLQSAVETQANVSRPLEQGDVGRRLVSARSLSSSGERLVLLIVSRSLF